MTELDHSHFTEALFPIMQRLNPGVADLEPYEFRYCLDNFLPGETGWAGISLEAMAEIERKINDRDFFISIKLKPKSGGQDCAGRDHQTDDHYAVCGVGHRRIPGSLG